MGRSSEPRCRNVPPCRRPKAWSIGRDRRGLAKEARMTTIRPAVELAAAKAMASRTEELFRGSGALKEGHFLLKSGKHSDRYLEKFLVLQDPAATSELCGFWAAQHRGADGAPLVDVVAGPTTGGIVLAFETARQLGVRGIFAEEVEDPDGSTRREFRRGFTIAPRERVLLVDDILTTGGSLLAMLPAVEALGGEVVMCAVLADRSGGLASLSSPTTKRNYPLRALWQLQLPTYLPGPATCPACAAGVPLYAPGSTGAVGPTAR
jgi:orotate phosphoribosyltransferase